MDEMMMDWENKMSGARNAGKVVMFFNERDQPKTEITPFPVNDDVWNWKCFDLLAIAGWYLGKKDEAIEYGKKAVQGNPSEKRLIDNLEWMQKNNANV